MKRFLSILEKTLYRAGGILLCAAFLWVVVLFGSFFLNLFGVLSYAPPLNQDVENIVRVELIDCCDGQMKVLHIVAEDQMEEFLKDFLKLKAKRYSNDPPSPYGEILVAVYYADGCVDRIGNSMNDYKDSEGQSMPAGGWYHFPEGTLESLFEKYIPK